MNELTFRTPLPIAPGSLLLLHPAPNKKSLKPDQILHNSCRSWCNFNILILIITVRPYSIIADGIATNTPRPKNDIVAVHTTMSFQIVSCIVRPNKRNTSRFFQKASACCTDFSRSCSVSEQHRIQDNKAAAVQYKNILSCWLKLHSFSSYQIFFILFMEGIYSDIGGYSHSVSELFVLSVAGCTLCAVWK